MNKRVDKRAAISKEMCVCVRVCLCVWRWYLYVVCVVWGCEAVIKKNDVQRDSVLSFFLAGNFWVSRALYSTERGALHTSDCM